MEYRGRQGENFRFDLIVNEMIILVAKDIDVFCDKGFFTVEDIKARNKNTECVQKFMQLISPE